MAVTVTKTRFILQPKIDASLLSAIVLLTVCSEAYSGDWQFIPRINSSLSYIDNISLAPADSAEASTVLEFTPGFALRGKGRRLAANVDYSLQGLFYTDIPDAEDGDKSKSFHRLSSSLNSELVQRLLFVDANASVSQQSSSALGKASVDNYSITEDRGTTSKYSISPYLRHQIGNGLRSELRYRYDELNGKKQIVADSEIKTVSLAMDSGRMLKKWQWTLRAKSSNVNYELQADQTHFSGDFGLRYRRSSRTTFSINGGTEKVEYSPDVGETGGDYWNVAMELKPGKRSSISVQAGERYYGESYGLSVRHKTKRANFGLEYNEELTNQSFVLLASQTSPTPSSGVGSPVQQTAPVLIDDIFLRKNILTYLNWKSGKSLIYLNASKSNDDYQQSPSTEQTQLAEASWRLQTSKKMTFIISGYYRHRKLQPVNSKESLTRVEMSLSRNIWPGAKVSGSVANIKQDASNNNLDYSQNRLTLGFAMHW